MRGGRVRLLWISGMSLRHTATSTSSGRYFRPIRSYAMRSWRVDQPLKATLKTSASMPPASSRSWSTWGKACSGRRP